MPKPPSRPQYFKDWQSSERVMLMNLSERGLYHEMLDYQWDKGSVPDDPALLAKAIRADREDVESAWPKVRECFDVDGGRLKNSRLEEHRQELEDYVEKQRKSGRKGGIASAEKRTGRRRAKRKPDNSVTRSSEPPATLVAKSNPALALALGSKSKIKNDSNTDSTEEREGPAVETVDNPKRDVSSSTAKPEGEGAANGKPPWLPDGFDPHDDRIAVIEREIVSLRPRNPSWIRELVGRTRDKRHAMDALATLARDFQHASLEETSQDTRILTVQKRMKEIVR